MDLLKRAGRSSNLASGHWLRGSVVVLEVALAFVLLVGSGLMMRSFVALQRAQPGYDPNGVLTFLLPNLPIPDDQARQAFVRDLRRETVGVAGGDRSDGGDAAAPRSAGEHGPLRDRRGAGRSDEVRPGDRALRAARVLRRHAHQGDRGAHVHRGGQQRGRPRRRDRSGAGVADLSGAVGGRTNAALAAANAGARAVQGDRRRRASASRLAGARRPRGGLHRRGLGGIRYGQPMGRAHERRSVGAFDARSVRSCPRSTPAWA